MFLKYYYSTVIGLRCFKDFVDATAAEILSMMSSRPTHLRVRTRCSVRCRVFGKPSELAENVLPIYEQVMIYCAWVRFDMKDSKKEPTFTDISQAVAIKVEQLLEIFTGFVKFH